MSTPTANQVTPADAEADARHEQAVRERGVLAELAERYHRVMKRFERAEWFGAGVKIDDNEKRVPVHVNSRRNPMPSLRRAPDGTPLHGRPMTLGRGRRRSHLEGDPDRIVFHVSRGDRREELWKLDIDCDEPGDWHLAAAYGRQVLARLFPNLETFDEPGRSWPRKAGAYNHLRPRFDSSIPKPLRRLIARLLNRHLKAIAAGIEAPAGVKFDGLKGLTTYEYANPYYDCELAASASCEQTRIYCLNDSWMRAFEAKQAIKAMAKANGKSPTDEQISDIIDDLPQDWRPKTRAEAYADAKLFYKKDDFSFRYCRELEPTLRHYGVLVTAPCFGAFSDDRENNVPAFLDWIDNKAGRVTVKQIIRALPEHYQQAIEIAREQIANGTNRPGRSPRASRPAATSAEPHQPAAFATREVDRPDIAIMDDDGEEPFARLCAAVRLYFRQTRGNIEQAAELAVAWYESDEGPATGHSPAEHDDRTERATRIAKEYAATFDPAKATSAGPLTITSERIADAARSMTGIIPGWVIKHVSRDLPRDRQLTRSRIALIHLIFLHNIATDKIGEVPRVSITGMLRSLGMSMTNSQIAAAKRVLVIAGLLKCTRRHRKFSPDALGECEQWRVAAGAWLPEEWAEPHITAEMRADGPEAAAVPAPAATRTTPARAAMEAGPTHPPPSFPPMRTIWGNSQWRVVVPQVSV